MHQLTKLNESIRQEPLLLPLVELRLVEQNTFQPLAVYCTINLHNFLCTMAVISLYLCQIHVNIQLHLPHDLRIYNDVTSKSRKQRTHH